MIQVVHGLSWLFLIIKKRKLLIMIIVCHSLFLNSMFSDSQIFCCVGVPDSTTLLSLVYSVFVCGVTISNEWGHYCIFDKTTINQSTIIFLSKYEIETKSCAPEY